MKREKKENEEKQGEGREKRTDWAQTATSAGGQQLTPLFLQPKTLPVI